MSQIDSIIKQLGELPYTDMVEFATKLRDELAAPVGRMLDAHTIAQVLAGLEPGSIEDSAETKMERRLLTEVFTRKRQISVSRHGNGFAVEVLTVPGSRVVGTDLRHMLGQMLDQIATITAMKKG